MVDDRPSINHRPSFVGARQPASTLVEPKTFHPVASPPPQLASTLVKPETFHPVASPPPQLASTLVKPETFHPVASPHRNWPAHW
jgi:hypothetical protein